MKNILLFLLGFLPVALLAQGGVKGELKTDTSNVKGVSVGAIAPNFMLADTAGKDVPLSSLRGHYVLLDFWASWCGPCRAESPHLFAAYHTYKKKGFTILAVSFDTDLDAWRAAIREDGMQQWSHLINTEDSPVRELYNVKSIPRNFLIDPEGKIIAVNLRGKELGEKLGEVME